MSSLREFTTLKNSKQFNYFYNNSKRQHLISCIVFFKRDKRKQVGFVASKKVGNAVNRNFAKRRLRALFIAHNHKLLNGTYIFVAKKDILEAKFSKVEDNFLKAFKKVGAICANNNS